MASSRTDFLDRIRTALETFGRTGSHHQCPARGTIGYQGAGRDQVATFRDALLAAGGTLHCVRDAPTAVDTIVALLKERAARKVLLGKGSVIDNLPLVDALSSEALEVHGTDTSRDSQFAADASVTGVDSLIAETGSVVIRTSPIAPRLFSLAPPVHIAVANVTQLVPDLFDLFDEGAQDLVPSCLTLITGPSKTGDIELKLVTGVHGPGELHVVLIVNDLV